MKTKALAEPKVARKVVFHRVAENLYRLETSGGYYGLVKRGAKQFRRSLKTKDRKHAERRLVELRARVGNLTITDEAGLTFDQVAKRWMDVTSHTLKPSSALRRELCIKALSPFFARLPIRNIQRQHCERWLTQRAPKLAPMSMNRELELMRSVFAYAGKLGLILGNPAEDTPTSPTTTSGISSRPPASKPAWTSPRSAVGLATRTAAPLRCGFTATCARSTAIR